MKNFKKFFSKVATVVVCSSLVASLTPISGVLAEEILSDNVATEETVEESVSAQAVVEAPVEILEESTAEASEETPVETVVEPPVETPEVTAEVSEETPGVVVEAPEETPEAPVEAPDAFDDALEEVIPEEPALEEPVVEPVALAEAPATTSADATASENVVSTEVSADVASIADIKALLASEERADYAETLDFSFSDGLNRVMSSGTMSIQSVTYYSQPAFYTNKDYDAISVYLTNTAGEYAQRTFFITDGIEWILYDYGETMAKEFFAQTELKDGRYIPVQKATSRKDNSKTAGIDESKIPTMTQEQFLKMVYDWRTLENVPFTRTAGGVIVYAGTGKEDESNPTPAPTPDNTQNQYVLTINSSTYDVRVTKSVAYNGRKHVSKNAKNSKTQINDLDIAVYRNGTLVEPKYYTLKYANNTNVNGYGKATAVPYFTVTLKNVAPYKKDRAQLSRNKFGFTIVPVDIAKANFSLKKVRVTGTTKITLGTPTAKIDGVTLKLSVQSSKNPLTGAFTASYKDGAITVNGVNNYAGSTTINLLSAKTMDYIF